MKNKTPRAIRKSLHAQLGMITDNIPQTSLDEALQQTIIDHLTQAQILLAKGKPTNQFTELPLTVERAKQMKDKDGFVKIVMPFTLAQLKHGGIDQFNDLVGEMVCDKGGWCLEDISYRLLGGSGQNGLLEVTCNVNHWLDAYDAI